LLYGAAELKLPAWDELGFETKHVCDQFATHHLDKCRHDIATDRRLVSCMRMAVESYCVLMVLSGMQVISV
jgi:hypothetical protein